MEITALVPWFGGKRTLAPAIIAALGPHRTYWEPFCGSMAVLLAKKPCPMETVNDLHGDLVNLARVIQCEETAAALYGRLARTFLCEELFRESRLKLIADWEPCHDSPAADRVERAYHYFVVSWFGRNGVAGTIAKDTGFCVRWSNGGGHAARRFVSAVESIPAWYDRLRHVTILRRNAFEVLAKIRDEEKTVIYCDPPYFAKSDKYIHDFEAIDHERLEQALMRFQRARVVLSYYDHPRLEGLYKGWSRQSIDVTKANSNASGTASRATEVLLFNSPKGIL